MMIMRKRIAETAEEEDAVDESSDIYTILEQQVKQHNDTFTAGRDFAAELFAAMYELSPSGNFFDGFRDYAAHGVDD